MLLLPLLCAGGMVWAGGGGEAAAGRPVSITMWGFPLSPDDNELFAPVIDSFQAEHPNVTIDLQIQPWQGRYEKMLAAIAGGDPPEVVYLNAFQVPLFADTGNLLDLSERLPADVLAGYLESALDGVSYRGSVYSLPILVTGMGYLYNVDLFEQAGLDPDDPPETWEELEAAAARLTKAEQWGIRFDLDRPSPITSVLPFIWQGGGDVLDDTGKVVINSRESLRALTYLQGLWQKGYAQLANVQGGGLEFSSGKIGMELQQQNGAVANLAKQDLPFEFRVGPILRGPGGKVDFTTSGSYGVFSKSSDPDPALDWVVHLTQRDGALQVLQATQLMPARKDVSAADYISDPRFVFMAEQGRWATEYGPSSVHYTEILNTLGSEFEAIMLDVKTPQQALADAQRRLEEIVR